MKIIGHRGAAGLETENTLEAIQKALDLGVDGVEFDVWTTKDGVPVVHHDEDLLRMTGQPGLIPKMKYSAVQKITNHGGKKIPTAHEALGLAGDKIILFEIKDPDLTHGVRELIEKFKGTNLRVISYNENSISELKALRPDLRIYMTANTHQFHAINFAARHDMYGITLSYRYFNPLIYWLARRRGLAIGLWTVNNPSYVRWLKLLGADIELLATDFPDVAIRILR